MFILIDNYDSFTYNLYYYFKKLDIDIKIFRNDEISIQEIARLNPQGIIISPGPGTPDSTPLCLQIIKNFKESIPILGVCLGHQAIGQFFGGRIKKSSKIMHGKTTPITHINKSVFNNIPMPFLATRYNSLIVEFETLPKDLEITATDETGEIMGLCHKTLPIHGIQFHPESVGTEYGYQLLRNFIKLC